MNKWVKKSIDLANGKGYLDKLSVIYPVGSGEGITRLTKEEEQEIKRLFTLEDKIHLLERLMEIERFPYDEPYIGYFRIDKSAITRNPETVARILSRLESMGIKKIIAGANKAKSESRRFGQSFRNWLRQEWGNSVYTNQADFINAKGIAFLDGGDKKLKEFATKHFRYRRKKGLDFVAKVNDIPVIGEAKFISASGGTQDKSFREGLDFLKKSSGPTRYVAVLDGVVWSRKATIDVNERKRLYTSLETLSDKHIALSALHLKAYLKELQRTTDN